MKTKLFILAAALLGGLLSTSAFAVTAEAHHQTTSALKFDAPAPASVVSPTGLSSALKGETIRLSLTIDASGQPHNIRVMWPHDQKLLRNVVSAVSQWRFTPGRLNGTPVSTQVVLPIQLVES